MVSLISRRYIILVKKGSRMTAKLIYQITCVWLLKAPQQYIVHSIEELNITRIESTMAAWITHNHLWSPSIFTVNHRPRSRPRLLMRNSSGETESVSPVEVPKGPPSLISALNVEKALRGIAITDEDHYGRLGVERGCSSDEVRAAYESKVAAGLGDDQEELKESYRILCTDEERRLYDWSLGRKDNPDRYMWPFEVDRSPVVSTESPTPQQPEDVQPTTLLGYFISTWFFLSILLLILFNT